MAKYLSYKQLENNKNFFKIHSSDKSKIWWIDKEPNLNFITVTENDFKKLKIQHPFIIDANNQLVFDPLNGEHEKIDITKDMVQNGLNKHIEAMELHLINHSFPLYTQEDLTILKNINLDSITWPVSCNFNSWVEALENNLISVDYILEL
jgi:hypothetical protein